MREKQTEYRPTSQNAATAEMLARSHKCFSCLTGASPEKRACARENLLSDGFSDALVQAFSASSKTEH